LPTLKKTRRHTTVVTTFSSQNLAPCVTTATDQLLLVQGTKLHNTWNTVTTMGCCCL